MIHYDLPVQGILTKENISFDLGQIEWNNCNFVMIDIDRRVFTYSFDTVQINKNILANIIYLNV